MDEAIKRSGPPRATATRGSGFMWEVPLTGTPSAEWRNAFASPGEATSTVQPSGVQILATNISQTVLTFNSQEGLVPEWITSIDKWIEHANGVVARQAAEVKRQGEAAKARRQEDDRRVREASDKFKDL